MPPPLLIALIATLQPSLQDAPIAAADFPAVERQAELGYLAITLAPRHLQPPQLEAALQAIVFWPDTLARRLAYCRLLVRHEAGAQLRRLQAELAYDEDAPAGGS